MVANLLYLIHDYNMISNVTLHARKATIEQQEKIKLWEKDLYSHVTVVCDFCLYFSHGALFGHFKWSEAQNILSPCFPHLQ